MLGAMDQYLSLEAAAVATGQPVARLRNWCATGKLECDKHDGSWLIPLSQLLRVAQLAAERSEAIARGRPVAAVVPVTSATPDLAQVIAGRLGLPANAIAMSNRALDGRDYLIAMWQADGSRRDLTPIVELVEDLGGELLDGEIQPG